MNEKITRLPVSGTPRPMPRPLFRPCDHGLNLAVINLESQLGTIEAYNRLVAMCSLMMERIQSGDVKSQNPLYSLSINGSPPKENP